ncbi:MAG TPA: hypothetical protein IGS53_11790 [Leptolyngbyaceae cyanobacterium M33_DOE_097]|uniref:Uncharacterized protein n=1 Tax=Oscillatoriales cyanobacterium SpSt-418 TaxID=2282169 RepID=A0A7C3PDD1_9CYAN|nr:hypothetical protein [Leptolyngbyaceae cyanobacterium M33_DOE_097]
MQVTIAALIWDKPPHLAAFLDACKARAVEALGQKFRGYDTDKQIHATIVGLERIPTNTSAFHNANFNRHRQCQLEMDYAGLLNYFQTCANFPIQIQIGGFQNRDYPFVSRGDRPFSRSFSIRPGRNHAGDEVEFIVMMGWPIQARELTTAQNQLPELNETLKYPKSLDSIRQTVQTFNALHAYHAAPTDIDNDFFFRIGIIDNPAAIDPVIKHQLIDSMREWLAHRDPIIVNVKRSDVWLIQYASPELPPDSTTNPYRITDPNLDADFCRSLY